MHRAADRAIAARRREAGVLACIVVDLGQHIPLDVVALERFGVLVETRVASQLRRSCAALAPRFPCAVRECRSESYRQLCRHARSDRVTMPTAYATSKSCAPPFPRN